MEDSSIILKIIIDQHLSPTSHPIFLGYEQKMEMSEIRNASIVVVASRWKNIILRLQVVSHRRADTGV